VTFGDKPGFNDSIDSSLFFDDDGKVYFQCNHLQEGIYQFEIDIETGQHKSPMRHLWGGTGGSWPEAPHLYKIDGRYYLLIAEGGTHTGHMVTIARSDTPWGPFEACPRNPILTHRSLYRRIQATGHAELFQAADGSWWLVCLAIRWPDTYKFNPHSHHLGRETYLAPVTWQDGWPVVGNEGRIDLDVAVDHLPGHPAVVDQTPKTVYDDFARPELPLYWNFLRNPHAEDWSLTEQPSTLTLHGSAVTLNDVASPAFIGRRQLHFDCVAATTVSFDPAQENEEAGLTTLMNESHHYEIAITRRGGQRSVIFRQRIGPYLQAELAREPIGNGPVTLLVEASALTYRFKYAIADGAPRELGTGTVHHLSTEVAGGFTGVYFGMYATGNGQPSTTPAHFASFEYRPV
jgi:xylan 1,4-beta-xylosidase